MQPDATAPEAIQFGRYTRDRKALYKGDFDDKIDIA